MDHVPSPTLVLENEIFRRRKIWNQWLLEPSYEQPVPIIPPSATWDMFQIEMFPSFLPQRRYTLPSDYGPMRSQRRASCSNDSRLDTQKELERSQHMPFIPPCHTNVVLGSITESHIPNDILELVFELEREDIKYQAPHLRVCTENELLEGVNKLDILPRETIYDDISSGVEDKDINSTVDSGIGSSLEGSDDCAPKSPPKPPPLAKSTRKRKVKAPPKKKTKVLRERPVKKKKVQNVQKVQKVQKLPKVLKIQKIQKIKKCVKIAIAPEGTKTSKINLRS